MLEYAAIAGCDPEPRTLRELDLMAKAADRAAWHRTFALLAQIFNASGVKREDLIDPIQFYPWRDAKASTLRPPTEQERQELRKLFPKK